MANIENFDPLSSEIQSPLIAGIIEAVNNFSQILNMGTEEVVNIQLNEVYIGEDDRYRIYQAPEDKRLWLKSPQPVIKINGRVSTPSDSHFSIDYIGGSIAFQDKYQLSASDTILVSATIIKADSQTLTAMSDKLNQIKEQAEKYKGYYPTEEQLKTEISTAADGDFAIVGGDIDSLYLWDSDTNGWKNITVQVDLSNYYTKPETDNLLNTKEPTLNPKGDTVGDDDFYYGGRKQWIDLMTKIRGFVLTGLSSDNKSELLQTDTLIVALGKLQAQLNQKVSKEPNKVLSTNDFTTAEKQKLAGLQNYNDTEIKKSLENKVDKISGKGLSTNDYTDDEKQKVGAIDESRTYTMTHSKSGTMHTLSGLPTINGIYTAQFKATANYMQGDRFSGYTAKPVGEETTLPDKAFISGDLVSVVVDTASKKLGFKLGSKGGGDYGTLPPQIKNFRAEAGNAQIKLFWSNPSDSNFAGLYLVRKAGTTPQKPSDGTKIDVKKTTSYTDTGLSNGTTYHYRAFPYNQQGGIQTELTGAVVSAAPKAGTPLGNLPVGTLVRVPVLAPYQSRFGQYINWKIADKNHDGYPSNSVTLITDKIIQLMAFDAKEPSNFNDRRRDYGNNRCIYSNILQWLNSNAMAGQWYSAKHEYDAPPNNANVWNGKNEYDAWAGFLAMLDSKFVADLLNTTLTVVKPNIDGGDTETFTTKMFLASTTEVGLMNENKMEEGKIFALFSDDTSRIAYPTPECVSISEFTKNDFNISSGWYWWLRTPYLATPESVRYVQPNGSRNYGDAIRGNLGIRPLCNLPNNTQVSPTTNPDGSYNLIL